MPNRSVSVELKALVSGYVAGMRQASSATKQTADQALALSKSETQLAAAVDGATASVKRNGNTLDQSTAKGRANKQALDQIAASTLAHRRTLIAQGASQAEVTAATERGRTAWLASASAMGMSEAQAKKTSATLFAASKALQASRAEAAALGATMGIAGLAVVAGVGLAVKSFADFDKQMSAVSAQGGDAKARLGELRAEALRAGADTQYSASEAAGGITELIKAGLTAGDVLTGGLDGALALAASGQMDVASAAEATATALNEFGLEGNQASHVADLLAAGANLASGGVSDMSMALSQSGLVAHQTGLSIDETVASLTLFAKAGLMGSDAGTSLKTMLMRLTPQSAEAQKQFDKLGISAYDSQGNFVGLAKFAGQLKDKLSDYSPEARNAALATMFGSDAVRAASILYEAGADGVQKMTDAVNQQGFAQRQAAELTNNLSGDLERLGGSLDTVFIQSGSGANSALRQMAQSGEALVNAIGQIPGPLLSVATILLGSGGLAVAGVGGMVKLGSTVLDARDNFRALGVSAKTAKLAVGGVGTAIAVGTIALSMWAEAQAEADASAERFASTMVVVGDHVQHTDATLKEVGTSLATDKTGWFGYGESVSAVAEKAGLSMADLQGYITGNADAITKVQDAQGKLAEDKRMDGAFTWLGPLGGAWANLDTQSVNLVGSLDKIKQGLSEGERVALAKAQADRAAALGSDTYSEALEKSNALGEQGTDILKEFAQQQFEAANAALKASGLEIGWQAALDDTTAAIKKNGKAARTAAGDLDLNTAKGRANKQALDQLAAASIARVQSMEEEGASETDIRKKMERTRQQFIKNAIAAGMTETAANALADSYKLIPGKIETNFEVSIKARVNAARMAAGHGLTKADGGVLEHVMGMLVDRFASGGMWGQPQVRPFQGAAGVQWGEQGSGPWEAFISGAPQKRDRSIAVWREVGQRLMGSFSASDMLSQFADGGIKEPTHKGKPLSWWQDYLKTDLELTRLQIQVRDLKASLRERETYTGKDKKKHRRLKLRGLDRTEARQELGQEQNELALSLEANRLNKSKSGTIAKRLSAWEFQDQKAKDAADAAEEKASAADQAAKKWTDTFMTGGSAAELLANMNAGATQLAAFNTLMGQLGSAGLSDSMTSWLWDQGVSSAGIAKQILAGGKSAIDAFNTASGNLAKVSDAAGQSQATGTWVPSPAVTTVPGYVASGSTGWTPAQPTGVQQPGKTVKFYVTQDDPYAASIVINQQLKDL